MTVASSKATTKATPRHYPERLRKRRTDRKKVATQTSAFHLRFDTFEQYDHVKKAAASLDPEPSLNVFIMESAVERASKVLGQPAPATPLPTTT